MSDNLVSGLLGGAMGFGRAVGSIGEKELEALRTRLRDEANAELQKKRDERIHGQNLEIQGNRQSFQTEQSKAEREFEAEQGDLDRTSRENIAKQANEITIKRLDADLRSATAAERRNMLKTQEMIQKAFKDPNLTQAEQVSQANALASDAGFSFRYELKQVSPAQKNLIGRNVEAGYEIRAVPVGQAKQPGGGQPGAANPSPGDSDEKDITVLLTPNPANAAPSPKQLIIGAEQGHMANKGDRQENPEPKGLIGGAMAASPEWSKAKLDPDPKKWDVRFQNGKYFVITGDGPVEMTQAQIDQWKSTTAAK